MATGRLGGWGETPSTILTMTDGALGVGSPRAAYHTDWQSGEGFGDGESIECGWERAKASLQPTL